MIRPMAEMSGQVEELLRSASEIAETRGHLFVGTEHVLLVMTPRIVRLIEAIHAPGADIPALFVAHDSEILGWG